MKWKETCLAIRAFQPILASIKVAQKAMARLLQLNSQNARRWHGKAVSRPRWASFSPGSSHCTATDHPPSQQRFARASQQVCLMRQSPASSERLLKGAQDD
jgi:hypothetical protein